VSETAPRPDPAPGASRADLEARALAWLEVDPDPVTRAELEALLARTDADALPELADRFAGPIRFGTSGFRAPMGAGPARMNQQIVRAVAAGLGDWLGPGRMVVVGHDARHRSADFARQVVAALAAGHCRVRHATDPVPTPLLAFAVRHLAADAGVMITASHNPKGDNGIKVYLGDGAQPVPPDDAEIEDAVAVRLDTVVPGDADPAALAATPGVGELGDDVFDAYVEHVAGLVDDGPRDLAITYTALHGVGLELTRRVFATAGFAPLDVVGAQAAPDGDFPTVLFPNPEEPGALDLAVARARAAGTSLVIAHDPDADRLGVAAPCPDGDRPDGDWRILDGDRIAALLADHLLRTRTGPDPVVVRTIVSSSLLDRQAEAHGVRHEQTLTGFRWVVRPGVDHPERTWVFGYEEALGFSVDGYVRDKDGIAAALVLADVVARLRAEGRTVWDRLGELAARYGHHLTGGWSWRFEGPGATARPAEAMGRLRAAPPSTVAGRAVTAVVDLASGVAGMPIADVVVVHLDDRSRLSFRPSGTEPKLKAYAEVVAPSEAEGEARLEALRRAATELIGLDR
jgi:phosphomannomutase